MKNSNLVYSGTFLLSREEIVTVNFDVENVVHSMRFALGPALTEPVAQLTLDGGRHTTYLPEVGPTTALMPFGALYAGRSMEWRISVEFAKTAHLVNVALVELIA